MKKTSVIMLAILLCTICTAQKYPFTNTVDSSDTSHNITIKDPYRWMEDLISDETKNWFKE